MQIKILLCYLGIVISHVAYAQNKLEVVIQNGNNQPVENAHIYLHSLDTILVSDINGQFEILLAPGNYPFTVTHIEYDTIQGEYVIQQDTTITMHLLDKIFSYHEVVIYGLRSDQKTPIAFTQMDNKKLNEINYGQDMPVLLQNTISAVATSDAGNGIGYTSLRIRGSDATRINVTINGVPFNDAESHQSYWVDIPDIAIATDEIQVQRGVGFSTNGPGAFGASINIFTNKLKEDASLSMNTSLGSFDLFRTNFIFSTGRFKEHWFVEGSGSYSNANGYIDRSFAQLRSFFLTAAFDSKKYRSVINIIGGKEKTYQSWAGVPADSIEVNRTYNPYTYENQTDNYTQTHLQWHNNFFPGDGNNLNITFNYTKGKGYFEQLEYQQLLSAYAIDPVTINDSIISYSDMITQKWLDNDFYGVIIDYRLHLQKGNNLLFGGSYFRYNGDHFNNIIWSEFGNIGIPPYTFYADNALKDDANIFAQWKYLFSDNLSVITDLQLRTVAYQFNGLDAELNTIPQKADFIFFNPKFGLFWKINPGFDAFLHLAYTSKEPNRDDFINSSISSRPKPEHLFDFELGTKNMLDGWLFQPNLYAMFYKDQLVLDGSINDVGAYTRINVPESYRLGIEMSIKKMLWQKLQTHTYFTLSENRILNYTQFYYNWDTGTQESVAYEQTEIAFSPGFVAGLQWAITCFQIKNPDKTLVSANMGLDSRFICQQFLDNTGDPLKILEAYQVTDLNLNLTFLMPKNDHTITLNFLVSNLFSQRYASNGWVYSYYLSDIQNNAIGYYPQAERAYYLKISIEI